jgi:X-X-X-Leu-X-X-Gly heptad repeat protein
MSHTVLRCSALASLLLAVSLVPGQFQVHAASRHPAAHHALPKVPTAVLVWQGKILPIVIAAYSSFSTLEEALQAHDVQGLADTANQFALEQQQVELVQPTPAATHVTAGELATGLHDLASGTEALAAGIRANDNAAAQSASRTIEEGLNLFQKAVDQIRRATGGALATTTGSAAVTAPRPTPIIQGLP